MDRLPGPNWLWVIVVVAIVAFIGQVLHLWTITFGVSIP